MEKLSVSLKHCKQYFWSGLSSTSCQKISQVDEGHIWAVGKGVILPLRAAAVGTWQSPSVPLIARQCDAHGLVAGAGSVQCTECSQGTGRYLAAFPSISKGKGQPGLFTLSWQDQHHGQVWSWTADESWLLCQANPCCAQACAAAAAQLSKSAAVPKCPKALHPSACLPRQCPAPLTDTSGGNPAHFMVQLLEAGYLCRGFCVDWVG